MKIEERFVVEAPQAEVWTVIRDAATIAPCVPGCRDVTLTGRLGNYGLGLMKKRAQALGADFAANLARLLATRDARQE